MDLRLTVDVTFAIEYSSEDGRPVEDVVSEIVRSDPRLTPARAVADSPYAVYVEFGTGPAQDTEPKAHPTEFERRLREWAMRKLGLPEAEAVKRASRIYRRIAREGLLPRPFFRPAIHDTMADVKEDWIDSGRGLQDIAEDIAVRARDNLDRHDQNDTRELRNSITADAALFDPWALLDAEPEGDIEQWIWDSDELSRDGTKRAQPGWGYR